MRVLVVEDDQVLVDAVREHVAASGHGVDWMKRIDEAREALASVSYDLVLLDLNLPDGRGLDLLRELRRGHSEVPVIVLTAAMDQIASRIEGLNSGADDYLVKPFDLSELSARVAAAARRYGGNPNPLVQVGDIENRHGVTHHQRGWAAGRFEGARMGRPREIVASTERHHREIGD